MRVFTFLIVAALSIGFARADILANGDFHDGKAHWKGDLKAASDRDNYGMSSIDHASDDKGIVVTLKPMWTKVSQDFNSHEKSFDYTVTYQLSNDFMPTMGAAGDYQLMPSPGQSPGMSHQTNPFLSALLGGNYSGDVAPPRGNQILLLIVDVTNSTFVSATITPDRKATGPQTATGNVVEIGAHDEKMFYLVFPAGKGSVTLLNVALTPSGKAATSTDPFQH